MKQRTHGQLFAKGNSVTKPQMNDLAAWNILLSPLFSKFTFTVLVCREQKWSNFSWIHSNTSKTRLFEIGKNWVCLEDCSLK